MYSGSGLCQATTGSKRSSSCSVRIDGVEADPVPEVAQAGDRRNALRRRQVVEDGLRHQEVGRLRAGVCLDLGHPQRRVEREIDVVPEEEIAVRGLFAEGREAVAAGSARRRAARGSGRDRRRSSSACEDQWNGASPPGSRSSPTSSSSSSKPASASRCRFTSGGKAGEERGRAEPFPGPVRCVAGSERGEKAPTGEEPLMDAGETSARRSRGTWLNA